jgi:hypothetical protein
MIGIPSLHAAIASLGPASLTKAWENTNQCTQGILRIRLSERDAALGELWVQILHADQPGSSRTMAFIAVYCPGRARRALADWDVGQYHRPRNLACRLIARRSGAHTPSSRSRKHDPRKLRATPAMPFADTVEGTEAVSFYAEYQFQSIGIRLQGYVVKGVPVIVSFVYATVPGELPGYMAKELFYRVSQD